MMMTSTHCFVSGILEGTVRSQFRIYSFRQAGDFRSTPRDMRMCGTISNFSQINQVKVMLQVSHALANRAL